MSNVPSGSVIGFQCHDPVADLINVATCCLPGWGLHHVGIVVNLWGEPYLYESTGTERPPCYRGGGSKGVGARPLDVMMEFCREHETKLWVYPLRFPLYDFEEDRLVNYLDSLIGLPYDLDGALHAGGGPVFRTLSAILRPENLASFFCSEMVCSALVRVGRFRTPSASRWSPNSLRRALLLEGTCDRPYRLL